MIVNETAKLENVCIPRRSSWAYPSSVKLVGVLGARDLGLHPRPSSTSAIRRI